MCGLEQPRECSAPHKQFTWKIRWSSNSLFPVRCFSLTFPHCLSEIMEKLNRLQYSGLRLMGPPVKLVIRIISRLFQKQTNDYVITILHLIWTASYLGQYAIEQMCTNQVESSVLWCSYAESKCSDSGQQVAWQDCLFIYKSSQLQLTMRGSEFRSPFVLCQVEYI